MRAALAILLALSALPATAQQLRVIGKRNPNVSAGFYLAKPGKPTLSTKKPGPPMGFGAPMQEVKGITSGVEVRPRRSATPVDGPRIIGGGYWGRGR